VLQPCAHAGLSDRLGDHSGRQFRCVVFDAKPLTNDVGVQRFQAGEPLQPTFENCDFLVAIHSLYFEGGLGVEFAYLTGTHRAARDSSTCVEACFSSSRMC
jgi:hypothetical protein